MIIEKDGATTLKPRSGDKILSSAPLPHDLRKDSRGSGGEKGFAQERW